MRRMVILAAGRGERLRPLTDDRPKCLVEVAGKPLIDWQLESATRMGLREVAVVTGYLAERFTGQGVRRYHNPAYADTNMVATLWCAHPEFQEELIVSYGDILYEDSVLQALIESERRIAVVIDLAWLSYWKARFPDPLSDAESLRLDQAGRIAEIGRKLAAIEAIQGQYIGLMKFRAEGLEALEGTYAGLQARGADGVRKMPMTDLLQAIIEAGHEVHAVPIHRKWVEVDSLADYTLANQYVRTTPDGLRVLI